MYFLCLNCRMLFYCFLLFMDTEAGLRVAFSNILEKKGDLYVAVYNRSEGFLDEQYACFKQAYPIARTGTIELGFPSLPPGEYAIACYQDLNGNGRLDRNLLGIPTEPYGFSNDARPRLRAPTWEEAKVSTTKPGEALRVRLEKW
jgi:uncharacterized protein (DUF2141 family)